MRDAQTKILIVDDDELVHRALAGGLRREPYKLHFAFDAAEAVAILERHANVRGIISDYQMPGLSGLDLLVQVRRRWPMISTVLLTGNADLTLATRAINEGHIHGFLTKPWQSAELIDLLHSLLNGDEFLGSLYSKQAEEMEGQLRSEMACERDPVSGAFLIEEPSR